MQSKTQKRYLAYLVLLAVFALSAASASSQERKAAPGNDAEFQPAPGLSCPTPRHIHLTKQASAAATPYVADFPSGPCSAGFEPNFGGTTSDRCFRHTFTLPAANDLCCQCVEGKRNTLTITYRALQPGPPGSNSTNDSINIYTGGPPVSFSLYTPPTGGGPPWQRTKVIPLTCAMLARNRLSFLVQDDTSVISAALDVDLCCVKGK